MSTSIPQTPDTPEQTEPRANFLTEGNGLYARATLSETEQIWYDDMERI